MSSQTLCLLIKYGSWVGPWSSFYFYYVKKLHKREHIKDCKLDIVYKLAKYQYRSETWTVLEICRSLSHVALWLGEVVGK